MNIGLDFGGVIANHQSTKLKVAQRQGISVSDEAEVVRAVLLPRIGKEEYDEIVRQTAIETLNFPVTDGIHEAFSKLIEAEHGLHIISTQETVSEDELFSYMKKNDLPIASISVVNHDGGKLAACKDRDINVFLDDSESVLDTLTSLNIPLFLAKFVTDYSSTSEEKIQTVRSWEEFVQVLESKN